MTLDSMKEREFRSDRFKEVGSRAHPQGSRWRMSVTKVGRISLLVVYTDGGETRTIVTPDGKQFQIASKGYPEAHGKQPLETLCRLLCDSEEVSP